MRSPLKRRSDAGADTARPAVERRPGIRMRAVLLALALIPVNACLLLHTEVVRHQAYPTSYSLFGNVIAFLLLVALLNRWLRRRFPRAALSSGELIACYILLCAGTAASNSEMGFLLVAMIGHPARFASQGNRWEELFGRYLPAWLTVRDQEALRGFYMGVSSFWQPANLAAWLPPLAAWLAFLLVLAGMMLCLNALLRRPWTEAQRLTFPLTALPLQLTDRRDGFFADRLMWLGFGVTALVDLVNGLSLLVPSIPELPRYINLALYWPQDRPWSAFLAFPGARIPFGIFPFIFGLGLLMPLDLSFSCWFFYLLMRFQAVAGAARGWDTLPGFPFDIELASGALLSIFGYHAWQMRRHLASAVRQALRGAPPEPGDPMSCRAALLGLAAGGVFLTAFSLKAGMSLNIALTFFALYFILSVALTRIRVEAGVASHDMYLGGPDIFLVNTLGSQRMGAGDLTGLSLFFWFNREYGSHPMPHQLEGFKMGERDRLPSGKLAGLMLLGLGAGAVSAFLVMLHTMYDLGAASGKVVECASVGGEPWGRLASWTAMPSQTNTTALSARGIGALIASGLFVLRGKGLWCPIHPVGLAMAGSWSMYKTWSSLFFSWLVKGAVMRYGGRKLYSRTVNFALGMVLGDCVTGVLWAAVGAAARIQTFNPWP